MQFQRRPYPQRGLSELFTRNSQIIVSGRELWAVPEVAWQEVPRAMRALRTKTTSPKVWLHRKLSQSTVSQTPPSIRGRSNKPKKRTQVHEPSRQSPELHSRTLVLGAFLEGYQARRKGIVILVPDSFPESSRAWPSMVWSARTTPASKRTYESGTDRRVTIREIFSLEEYLEPLQSLNCLEPPEHGRILHTLGTL